MLSAVSAAPPGSADSYYQRDYIVVCRNLGIAEPLGAGVEPGYWWDFGSPGLPRSGMRRGWEAPQGGQRLGDAAVARAMRQAAEQARAMAAAAEAKAKAVAKEAAAEQVQAAAAPVASPQEGGSAASQVQQAGLAVSEV